MRAYLRAVPFITLLSVLVTPTVTNAQADGSVEDLPAWVQKAMAKEIRKPKLREVDIPIDTISAKMFGKPEAAEAIEDGWYFISDIKAGSPLECYIYTTGLDLASLTNLLAENNIVAVSTANNGTIGTRSVHYVDAGVVDGFPYLALEWIYTLKTEQQTVVGFTKVRAATKGDISFACSHNYLGYRETFADAFTSFVESAEYEVTAPAPFYEEIAHFDYNGVGSGVAYVSYTEDDEGDIRVFLADAAIVPVDAATITTSDAVTISFVAPDGELYNSTEVTVENGEITSNLSLQRNDANDWVSAGHLQGKEIETLIDGTLSPASELRMITTARDLFAGTDNSATLDVWVPSVDPTRLLQTTITRDDAETEGQANVSLGPISYVGLFDKDGNIENASMSLGPVTINIERIWAAGSLSK